MALLVFHTLGDSQLECESFYEWLRQDWDESLYWITGKAGAGKSTLMNVICQDGRRTELLKQWASNHDLCGG
jgi:hypothetical protein